MSKITEVHIFSPGTQTSAQGVTREFSKKDLQQVVESYTPSLHEAPIRVGHEDNDKVPAWGWVKGVKLKGEDLYAEVEFSPQMGQYIRDGLYKKVSASFYSPESKINPAEGQWSLRHVAMLGAQPPAVKGLKGFSYSEDEDGVVDFAQSTGVVLTPDQVFDEELGPTLHKEMSPLEMLKEHIDEARQQMANEEQEKQGADALLEEEGLGETEVTDETDTQGAEFAEDEDKPKKAAKKKVAPGDQGAEDAEEEVEEDTSDNKEKMDPVGEEDSDVDNDGDSDSSDEFLKKRRAAIKKSMKKSDYAEEDSVDHAGSCGSSKKKNYKEGEAEGEDFKAGCGSKKYKEGDDEAKHGEIEVPEGADEAQWTAGFKDAVDKFYTGVEAGADEVVHEEAEDQTADYLAGIEAGFEYAQAQLNRVGSDGIGSASHDDKCCDNDEVVDGEGPVASKVKKQKTGANETDPVKGNNFAETTKKGKDGTKNTEKDDMAEEDDDEVQSKEGTDSDFGRDEVAKAGEDAKSRRKEKGVGKAGEHDQAAYDKKGTAPEEDRSKKGTGKPPKANGGKSRDVQETGQKKETRPSVQGSGKQIKSPAVRVMRFSEAQFSEMNDRLAQLEAMNAKLVQEKQVAERKAHRMQLEEFAESLYATGRLTGAVIDEMELVDYMEGLEHGTLEFAEGESAATKLMDLLAALPQQVSFSEIAPHDPEAIPVENLDPHEKALRLSKEEGLDYAEALKQTLFSAE